MNTTYASRSTAVRAAKKQGLTATRVLPTADGRHAFYASPVAFMWAFLDNAVAAGMPRIEQARSLKALNEFNPATVNTQVSRYHTAKGDRSTWYKIDRARKDARVGA